MAANAQDPQAPLREPGKKDEDRDEESKSPDSSGIWARLRTGACRPKHDSFDELGVGTYGKYNQATDPHYATIRLNIND